MDADSIDQTLTDHSELNAELTVFITQARKAEAAFDALDHHNDPSRRELLALLNRLRLGKQDANNDIPLKFLRPGLCFSKHELSALTSIRAVLNSSVSGRTVRKIVNDARNRYPDSKQGAVTGRTPALRLTESEVIDLADAWVDLPLEYAEQLCEAVQIHNAAKHRQLIQSGFGLIRAARPFIESARCDGQRVGSPKRFTAEARELAEAAQDHLDQLPPVRSAKALLDEALERYDRGAASANAPIGLMLSAADLHALNQLRDSTVERLETDFNQLRRHWSQPASVMQILPQVQCQPDTACNYALRFDGSQTATTNELSGLQFWCELLLERYYLALQFNVVIRPALMS